MITILFVVMGFALLIGLVRLYAAFLKRHVVILVNVKLAALEPLVKKLELNETIAVEELAEMCEESSLRPAIFHLLRTFNRAYLFPASFFTCEKGAESYLVNWLEFPTELGAKPYQIAFLEKVILMEMEVIDYYVFKFTAAPSSEGKDEWMIGACGPYSFDSPPYHIPSNVYSRYKILGTVTPDSEVQWIHANIGKTPVPAK